MELRAHKLVQSRAVLPVIGKSRDKRDRSRVISRIVAVIDFQCYQHRQRFPVWRSAGLACYHIRKTMETPRVRSPVRTMVTSIDRLLHPCPDAATIHRCRCALNSSVNSRRNPGSFQELVAVVMTTLRDAPREKTPGQKLHTVGRGQPSYEGAMSEI